MQLIHEWCYTSQIFYPNKLSQMMCHLSIGWWNNTINSLEFYKELSTTQLMTHHLGKPFKIKNLGCVALLGLVK